MNLKMAVIALVLVLPLAANAQNKPSQLQQTPDEEFQYNAGNLKYVEFSRPSGPKRRKFYTSVGMEDWIRDIKKSAMMLPESFFEKIGKTEWGFRADSSDWATGNPGLINLTPISSKDKPDWMTWEPLNHNGFTETERVFVALHEMAHIYDAWGVSLKSLYGIRYKGVAGWENNSPSMSIEWPRFHCAEEKSMFVFDLFNSQGGGFFSFNFSYRQFYGLARTYWEDVPWITLMGGLDCHEHLDDDEYKSGVSLFLLESEATLYGKARGQAEDFAESFALYVMWPDYLKTKFPMRYEVIRKILVREYKSIYPMPRSIKSRLSVKP